MKYVIGVAMLAVLAGAGKALGEWLIKLLAK